MKVKIGDKIYDGAEVPVMVILTPGDKKNIKNMLPEATKYAQCPQEYPDSKFKSFMKNPKENG